MKNIIYVLSLLTMLVFNSTSQAEIVYIHNDALGSPIMETNELGAVVSRSHYKPFGGTVEGGKDDVGYTGHLNDTDLGLTYMQARYYDPVIGRFYSNDPVGFIGTVDTFNRYSYVGNNPYKYIDPTGMTKKEGSNSFCGVTGCDYSYSSGGDKSDDKASESSSTESNQEYSVGDVMAGGITIADASIGTFACVAGGCNWIPSSQLNTTVFKTFGKILMVGAIGLEGADFSKAYIQRDGFGMADSGVDMAALLIGVGGGSLGFVFSVSYGLTDMTIGPMLSNKIANGLCSATGDC